MLEDDNNTLTAPIESDNTAIDAAFAKSFPKAGDIDISFFSHQTRRSTALVGNELEENFIKARRHWLDFDLRDVVYVSSIRVYATGYETYHEMELSYVPYLGQVERSLTSKFSGDHFLFHVNDFAKGFGLKPSDPLFKTAQITKILVSGVEKEFVTGIARFVENIEREKTRIEDGLSAYFVKAQKSFREIVENQEVIDGQSELINERQDEIRGLAAKVQELTQAQTKAQEEIQIASTVRAEQDKRSEVAQQAIERLVDERKELTSQISHFQSQLQELKGNINLFPTELAGYVKQGTRIVRLYAGLCLIPLAIMIFVTQRLFSNSERLLDTLQNLGNISIFEFLVSRIPYVAVSAAILGICYTTIKALISEIIAINRRRQELYKICIIATDVSYASQDDMELTDEQRYELRTQTKMELLKEHLKQNVGEDYSYNSGRVFKEIAGRLPSQTAPTGAAE